MCWDTVIYFLMFEREVCFHMAKYASGTIQMLFSSTIFSHIYIGTRVDVFLIEFQSLCDPSSIWGKMFCQGVLRAHRSKRERGTCW